MVIAALLIIAPIWKLPQCPSVSECTNWYIHTTDYYSATQQIGLVIPTITWKNLQRIMLSGKRNQS